MGEPRSAPGDALIGARVNGFIMVRKLAEGGMGAVYLAEHARLTNIHKVIKVLLPEHAQIPYLRQRFEREALAASKLKHEHILEIDDYGELPDGQLWLMMPYLVGQPLDEFLRGRRLAEYRALHIVLQLCSAVEHAHKSGIVHRDLKPGNVYVCPTDKQPLAIKLLDFGIAKIVNAADDCVRTRSGSAMGTPSYMAVEQYQHADEATARSDVYAIAVMTLEMVTGRLPWGAHEAAVLYHLQCTEPPNLEGLSRGWQAVVRAGLAVEPRDRPGSAREYAMALASATPAPSPWIPGGAEMLRTVAPELATRSEPVNETIRSQAKCDLVAPLSWSAMALPPTPPHAASPQATTIAASPGVVASVPERRRTRWKLALAGSGVALAVVGLSAVGLVDLGTAARSPGPTGEPPAISPSVRRQTAAGAGSPPVASPRPLPTANTDRSEASAAQRQPGAPQEVAPAPANAAPAAPGAPRRPSPSLWATPSPELSPGPARSAPRAQHSSADRRQSTPPPADDDFDPNSPVGR